MKSAFMPKLIRATAALMLALLLGGSWLVAQSADLERVNNLLQQAKQHAVLANNDAEKIESYTRSSATWKSHASQLNLMKEHVNEMGKILSDLNAAKAESSPWQQEAISEVDPLLRSMADHLTAMIQHLNDNQTKVHMPPYKDYAKANAELSSKMLTMISDYVDYSRAKATADALEQKLELPTSAEGA